MGSEDTSEMISWSGHISRHYILLGMLSLPLTGLALCVDSQLLVGLFILGERMFICPVLPI